MRTYNSEVRWDVTNKRNIFSRIAYKYLVEKSDNTLIQLFRYFFVGGGAFVVDFSILYLCTEYAHIDYLISAAIAFLAGLTVNFFISIIWVFSKSNINNRAAEFILFGVIGVVGLGLNECIIWLFTEVFHFHYLLSKLFSTGIVFMWNFLARKFFLYRPAEKSKAE
ncbi:MAG: GtrA family protein [Myxococcota bacterium]|nr:GtrA family protein [Myxococcota bacterium]